MLSLDLNLETSNEDMFTLLNRAESKFAPNKFLLSKGGAMQYMLSLYDLEFRTFLSLSDSTAYSIQVNRADNYYNYSRICLSKSCLEQSNKDYQKFTFTTTSTGKIILSSE